MVSNYPIREDDEKDEQDEEDDGVELGDVKKVSPAKCRIYIPFVRFTSVFLLLVVGLLWWKSMTKLIGSLVNY